MDDIKSVLGLESLAVKLLELNVLPKGVGLTVKMNPDLYSSMVSDMFPHKHSRVKITGYMTSCGIEITFK